MATVYPGAIDNFPLPAPTDLVENVNPDLDHNTQHANANLAIKAIETELGVTVAPAAGSVRDRLATLEAASGGGTPGVWTPADQGFLAWAFDPANIDGDRSYTPVNGTLIVVGLKLAAGTVTNVHFDQTNTANTCTSAWACLFNSAGTLMAQNSSSQHAAINAGSGLKTFALSTPQAVSAGKHYIGFWLSSTSNPSVACGSPLFTAEHNMNLSTANLRFASANTALTSTAPASVGTKTGIGRAVWAAVS